MTNEEIITKIRLFADEQRTLLADFESNSNFRKGEITAYSATIAFLSDLEKSLPEKVTDGKVLEEEIKRYYDDMDGDCRYVQTARHFYDLGCTRTAEKYDEIEYNRQSAEDGVPKDLEEAAWEYASKECEKEAFIVGANWQKQHDAELIEIAYNDGITIGMTKQKEQVDAIITSRLSEIIGDAQPKPALRAELEELIAKIRNQ